MIPNPPNRRDLKRGGRFVTGSRIPHPGDFLAMMDCADLVHEVTAFSHDFVETTDHLGIAHRFAISDDGRIDAGTAGDGRRRVIQWQGPLPSADAASILRLCDMLGLKPPRHCMAPLLMLAEDQGTACMIDVVGSSIRLSESIRLPSGSTRTRPGDLIILTGGRMHPSRPASIATGRIQTLLSGMDEAAVRRWMPADDRGCVMPRGTASGDDLERSIDEAIAGTQTDQALVASVPGDPSRLDATHVCVLKATGAAFFQVWDLVDHFDDAGLAEGLWVAVEPKWSDGGEDGPVLSVTWRRAEAGDLASFGVTTDETDADIADLRDEAGMPGETMRLIGLGNLRRDAAQPSSAT